MGLYGCCEAIYTDQLSLWFFVHNLYDQKAPEQDTHKGTSLLLYATVYQ